VQVHGGMGFIEETGAAQHMRDARITTIYEGTTGIQALDLVGRKVARDGGATAKALLAEMSKVATAASAAKDADLNAIGAALKAALSLAESASLYVVENFASNPRNVAAGSVPYLMLFGTVCGGWQMARAALIAHERLGVATDKDFYATKIATARYYADHMLARCGTHAQEIMHGAESTLRLDQARF
jgi:3-(methylsulfanyl)propanoyl-CoA dehydrogenase